MVDCTINIITTFTTACPFQMEFGQIYKSIYFPLPFQRENLTALHIAEKNLMITITQFIVF